MRHTSGGVIENNPQNGKTRKNTGAVSGFVQLFGGGNSFFCLGCLQRTFYFRVAKRVGCPTFPLLSNAQALRQTLTNVQESTIRGKFMLMSCANSKRFGVDFSSKLCAASHGLGGENLGWYGLVVHFLRVQHNILVGTATDKLILILARCVLARCLSTTPNNVNQQNQQQTNQEDTTSFVVVALPPDESAGYHHDATSDGQTVQEGMQVNP